MKLVRKKEFAAIVLDLKDEIFIVYFATLTSSNSDISLSRQAQIASLKTDEAPTATPNKYVNLPDISHQASGADRDQQLCHQFHGRQAANLWANL